MTMAPLGGIVSSAAGAPLSQATGSEVDRTQKDSAAHTRQVDANQQAERAAGIGQTEQDQEAFERDADGRRLWEAPPDAKDADANNATGTRQSKDATGQSGTQLDLTG